MVHVIGIADMKVSATRGDVLITYALGSCLAIAIHDPVACVGGLLHTMLPLSTAGPEKARQNPCMYVDTGIPKLFNECFRVGARKDRLIIKVAGGASHNSDQLRSQFNIGRRNYTVLRKLLWKNDLLMKAYDVGGNCTRSLALEIGSGKVIMKVNGSARIL